MKKIITAFLSLLFFATAAQTQVASERLAKLPTQLREKIGKDLPGWTQRSIKPIEGSENVVIEQWESGEVTVKVAVIEYKGIDLAVKALEDFKNHLKTEEGVTKARGKTDLRLVKDDLPVLGDGGFIWDLMGSEAAVFRKENYLVYVSIPRRPQAYKESRLSRQFAERVADVLAQ